MFKVLLFDDANICLIFLDFQTYTTN